MSVIPETADIESPPPRVTAIRPAPAAPSTLRLVAAFAIVYVVWGSTYLAIRIAIETLPPFTMAGLRYVIAGGLLFPLVRWRDKTPLTRRHWRTAGTVGCLMLLGGNGLVCWAEQTVASGLAALLIATVPIWMVVLDWLVYRGPRPTRTMILGLAVGLAGIYLLIGPENFGGRRLDLLGGGALLLACVFWTLGSLYSRRHKLPGSNWLATAMEMLAGGAALLLVGAATGEPARLNLPAVSPRSLFALAYLVVFGSIVALTAYKWMLQVSTPARAATYAYVNPVIAILLGTALAAEPFTPRIALAATVILAAVVLITRCSASPRD